MSKMSSNLKITRSYVVYVSNKRIFNFAEKMSRYLEFRWINSSSEINLTLARLSPKFVLSDALSLFVKDVEGLYVIIENEKFGDLSIYLAFSDKFS